MRHASITQRVVRASSLIAALLLVCPSLCAQPFGQKLSPSIVRWYPTKEAADSGVPSHALETQPKNPPEAGADFPIKPEYGTAEGRTTARVHVEPGTSLYGAG